MVFATRGMWVLASPATNTGQSPAHAERAGSSPVWSGATSFRAVIMRRPGQTSVMGEGRAALCDGDETSLGMAASFSAYGVAGSKNGIGERNVDAMSCRNCQDGSVTPASIIPWFCADCGLNYV